MGQFITAEEVRSKTLVSAVKGMTTEQIDDRLIDPAERMIEEAFNLNLDTDADPSHLAAYFDRVTAKRTQFQNDFRKSLILIIDRMAINPYGYGSQNTRGANVTFGRMIPREVRSLMHRWARPATLYRR